VRLGVTGTPGTGKTTATDLMGAALDVVHLNDVIRREGLTTGRDESRDSLVADVDAAAAWLGGQDDVVIESHLAHNFEIDRVAVLRCRPDRLRRRLGERGEPETTIAENAESEALDLLLSEAVERHGRASVHEIDTTDRTPSEVAAELDAVVAGEREPAAGTVSFVDHL
jgi:Predicted nucleotide kinase (related to CMP and AMP kinases)